jgi:hypothetical protein
MRYALCLALPQTAARALARCAHGHEQTTFSTHSAHLAHWRRTGGWLRGAGAGGGAPAPGLWHLWAAGRASTWHLGLCPAVRPGTCGCAVV